METKQYLCIDLKSFYASVECVERGLDPMTTDLVVADPERSDRTICLAVSPSLKAKGIRNRCRLFEIPQQFSFIIAEPRMQKYIEYSANIYEIYLRYVSPEDIHVYSIDESFLDVTPYLKRYGLTAKEMAVKLMKEIEIELGIRATCGIGTNLYLTKIALDITAKHAPDFIGQLDEESYRRTLWRHQPLTDFWRVGEGTVKRLAQHQLFTMEDIAKADEDLLYRVFGIDAELLIDHAWGREPTTIADIKQYVAKSEGLSSGQVLMRDYSFEEAELIVSEMTDALCLSMARKSLVTRSLGLMVGYSNALKREPAKGTVSLLRFSNHTKDILPEVKRVYRQITDPQAPIRRITISCNQLEEEEIAEEEQINLFEWEDRQKQDEKEQRIQEAMLSIKGRFGKNSILKGISLEEAATMRERNRQIGGHKSGE